MATDPRTVTVTHPEHGTSQVTPEVAQALTGGSYGPWTRDQAEAERIAELEAELARLKGEKVAEPETDLTDVPAGTVDEVIAWIGDDPERAQAALDAEDQRDKPRTTLTDHARSVLNNPTPNDPAGSGQED